MSNKILIVGCGYIGSALAKKLARDRHTVYGVYRNQDTDQDLADAGVQPIHADVTRPETFTELPEPVDWIVNAVSSRKGGADTYHEVYVEGTQNLINFYKDQPPKKYVHISSTSVYGQTDGSVVREDSETCPQTETGRKVLETEELLLKAHREYGFPAVILRTSGIYGPDRGHFFQQFLAGTATISGNPHRHLNMIHRGDLVDILQAALKYGKPGQIYNATDDEPVPQAVFFRWLADALGQPMPPHTHEPSAEPKKRGTTDKRVSNRRMRMELGVDLKYPTFREGLTDEIERLVEKEQINVNMGPVDEET